MFDRTKLVVLEKDEYTELIRKAERVAIIERELAKHDYISAEDLRIILNIKKENENETV